MGGGSSQTQTTQQKTKTNQNTKNKTGPYEPAVGPINDIISAAGGIPGATSTAVTPEQQAAVAGLQGVAQNAATQFNPQQEALVNDLYAGAGLGAGTDYLTSAGNALQGYLGSNYLDPNTNPYTAQALNNLWDQAYNNTANKFALAGRDLSGNFANALGKGYAQGAVPTLLGQYNQNVQAQQNAANSMPGIASGLDATGINQLNARQAASGAISPMYNPYTSSLNASNVAAGLPYTNLNYASQFLTPLAQLGGTSKGKSSGTSNTTGTTTTTMSTDPMQTLLGGLLGGLSLVGGTGGFGSTGWLTNAFK